MPVLTPMSKKSLSISAVFAWFLLILQFFTFSAAQDIEIEIKIGDRGPATAEVEGRYLNPSLRKNARNLSFLNEYAGVSGLAERISDLGLADQGGTTLTSKRFGPGDYVASGEIALWRNNVDLSPLKQSSASAHISWIKDDTGLIMLDDLLPQGSGPKMSAKVKFILPPGWKVYSTASNSSAAVYEVADVEAASFVIGRRWREINEGGIRFLVFGDRQFTDDDAAKMASEVFENYVKVFGSAPVHKIQIALFQFPHAVSAGNWEADTRGGQVTIVSSDMPFKTQSMQRLHEQLRHEFFHLWIPNGVNLTGNYDWFYEGFALYQSLKTGVGVNRLRFEDMLDTLSRTINIDSMRSKKLSLTEASNDRWTGSNTQVYARGMLAAFLCDLALLEASKGKRSVTGLVSEIYERHRPPALAADGTATIIAVMRSYAELKPIIDRYIIGREDFDWPSLLRRAGIEAEISDQIINLRVKAKPSGRQKEILDKLGYNNWRKLGSK